MHINPFVGVHTMYLAMDAGTFGQLKEDTMVYACMGCNAEQITLWLPPPVH